MESEVYFTNVRIRSDKENKINKVRRLFDAAGIGEVAGEGDLAVVKVHFGERGTDALGNKSALTVIAQSASSTFDGLGISARRDESSDLYGISSSEDSLKAGHGPEHSASGSWFQL